MPNSLNELETALHTEDEGPGEVADSSNCCHEDITTQ